MFKNLCDVDEVDHLLAKAGGGHLLELNRVAHRRHIGDELTGGFDVELLLGGASAGAAGQPCKLLACQIAALRLAHVGLTIALDALQHVCRISAFERLNHAVVNLPHGFAHFVQKPTVVGDEQQYALTFGPTVLQVLGQPVDGDHIKMVGGLVERENIPVLKQQSSQIGAATLAAGQGTDLGVQAHAAEQGFHDLARGVVGRPFVVRAAFQCGFADGGVVVKWIALVEHAEGESTALRHAAGVRLLGAAEQVKQRGFAVAVLTDNADTVALEYTLGHIGEDGFGGEGERNVFQSNVISRHDSPM